MTWSFEVCGKLGWLEPVATVTPEADAHIGRNVDAKGSENLFSSSSREEKHSSPDCRTLFWSSVRFDTCWEECWSSLLKVLSHCSIRSYSTCVWATGSRTSIWETNNFGKLKKRYGPRTWPWSSKDCGPCSKMHFETNVGTNKREKLIEHQQLSSCEAQFL